MASRGKTTQLKDMYVADFETCDSRIIKDNEKDINEYGVNEFVVDQKVWFAGHKNLETMKTTFFYSIEEFMKDILSRKDNVNTEYAFHNLKFDGSYVIPALFKMGYSSTNKKPNAKEFTVLVDQRNAWYSITIQVTTKRKVTLWDSQKLFPAPLEYLPDVYATPSKKLKEDNDFYERFRPDGYKPNQEEVNYLENDLAVLAETLNKHIEFNGLRFKKTQASQSFYNFEQSFKAWKMRFPPLTIAQDEAIRLAYWGGISYVPPEKAGKDLYDLGAIDINSSYPHKAATKKLPYGHVLHEYGEGKHPDMSKFWVAEALVEFELKDNCIPCIPAKALTEGFEIEYNNDKWVANSNGIVKMIFSCIDYKTIQMSYKIFKVRRWKWSMHWAWKVHPEISRFVHKNNDLKMKYGKLAKECLDETLKATYTAMRNRPKIDNNAFYGKFGEDIIKEGKTPYFDEDGQDVFWEIDRKEVQTENKRKFLPVAIAITAWGRQQLVEMANLLGEYFCYSDTDSCHFLLKGQHILDKAIKDGKVIFHDHDLGAWSVDGTYQRGRYLRPKCYMEETYPDEVGKTEIESTVGGLPADKHTGQFSKKRSCLSWDNFHIGTIIPPDQTNKLRTVRTKTGNKLVPTKFKIQEKPTIFD